MSKAKKQEDKPTKTRNDANTNAEANSDQKNPTKEGGKKDQAEAMPPPEPGLVEMYFSQSNNALWARNKQGCFQAYSERAINIMLRRAGYSDLLKYADTTSYLEAEFLRICEEQSVSFAGPLGGFNAGLTEYNGHRILVSNSPTILEAKKGDCSLLKDLIGQLLLDEGLYFYGWIKHARDSLKAGLPWGCGQLLVLAGPEGCGKSVLQSLITTMLGGRASSPYKYMTGSTEFNGEIYSAEHGLIGDQNHKTTKGSRRAFGAAIKELTVNPEQWVHGKHKTGCTLSAFLRLSMSVNDDPYALQALPEMESNVRNKLMVLQCNPTVMPFPSPQYPTMHAYSLALKKCIPALLHEVEEWQIPEEMRSVRYGIRSYHSPSVMMKLASLSDEWKFWQFVEMYLFSGKLQTEWNGFAIDLEKILREEVKGESLSALLHYPGACGQYLTSLADKLPDRIIVKECSGNVNHYTIRRQPPPE